MKVSIIAEDGYGRRAILHLEAVDEDGNWIPMHQNDVGRLGEYRPANVMEITIEVPHSQFILTSLMHNVVLRTWGNT